MLRLRSCDSSFYLAKGGRSEEGKERLRISCICWIFVRERKNCEMRKKQCKIFFRFMYEEAEQSTVDSKRLNSRLAKIIIPWKNIIIIKKII